MSTISSESVRRIIVLRALFLGDLICALPAFRLLRQRFPEAEITLMGLPWTAELVQRVDCIDRLVLFPGCEGIPEVPYNPARTAAFIDEARRTGYDLAIQMQGNGTSSNDFVGALGARSSWGYGKPGDKRLDHVLPHPDDDHEIVRWLRLAEAIGSEQGAASSGQWAVDDPRLQVPRLRITPAEQQLAADMLAATPGDGPLVALHAGAKEAARRWPPERFAAVADALVARYNARIVLTGSAAEREITAAVRRAMHAPALDLAGATDIGTFSALIDQLDLLVTNDTGASHIAISMGTRSVVLYGPSRPQQWGPLDRQRHQVIDALINETDDRALALRQLPAATVVAACAAMLNEWHQEGPDHLLAKEIGHA